MHNADMQTATTAEEVLRAFDRYAYRARQYGLTVSLAIPGRLFGLLRSPFTRFDREVIAVLQRRYEALLARDLANVERGDYPRDLLYQLPLLRYLRQVPAALTDLPRFLWRSVAERHDDLPADVDRSRYPHYYLRTFHWQTDGWLSDHSARLYDPSVEFLFAGTADTMRRMAIPPLVAALRGIARPRLLDVACGTGRFLLQLSRALPGAKLYGVDLSPPYLEHAQTLLAGRGVSLVNENAEAMPWADASFDAVASVFLFHELPSDARRRVAEEMFRVVKPGGAVVVCDSAQLADSREIEPVLRHFPAAYHEPYYKGYLRDDLAALLAEAGFAVESSEPHLVSKVVVARRPRRPARRRTGRP
ncbi:class I SAM-dependent methyltransferase [bacterium]|nr:class I SAM-dependent methyltransferase [bacterium]